MTPRRDAIQMQDDNSPTNQRHALGAEIAAVLTRSWDPAADALDPGRLREPGLRALLRESGAMGLVWNRLRRAAGEVKSTGHKVIQEVRLQHRGQLLQARIRERGLAHAVTLLRSAEIEPLVVKGWAIARAYPDPAMRPYGDLDLCLRDVEHDRSIQALEGRDGALVPLELHRGSHVWGDVQGERLFERSRLVELKGAQIRVPSEEEHLRLLCLHLLGHGGWRPSWLCDVAVALETRAPDFDWDLCLRGDPRLTRWVAVTLALARDVLGARLEAVPSTVSAARVPHWLIPELYQAWSGGHGANMDATPGASLLQGGPRCFIENLRRNWRNGIQASIELRAPANGTPRMPYRVVASLARVPTGLRALFPDAANVPSHGELGLE